MSGKKKGGGKTKKSSETKRGDGRGRGERGGEKEGKRSDAHTLEIGSVESHRSPRGNITIVHCHLHATYTKYKCHETQRNETNLNVRNAKRNVRNKTFETKRNGRNETNQLKWKKQTKRNK